MLTFYCERNLFYCEILENRLFHPFSFFPLPSLIILPLLLISLLLFLTFFFDSLPLMTSVSRGPILCYLSKSTKDMLHSSFFTIGSNKALQFFHDYVYNFIILAFRPLCSNFCLFPSQGPK